jgi:hypothetical protein
MVPASSAPCEVVLIGGQIGSGKSTVAQRVSVDSGCRLLRVRGVLQDVLGGPYSDRHRLQIEGAALDVRTGGRWLLHYLEEHRDDTSRLVIDAARTRRQVEPILEAYLGARLVYLAASEASRRHRFALGSAADPVKRSMPFDEAMRHETETEARTIAAMAHLIVETDDRGVEDVVAEIIDWCGWKKL